MSWFQLDPESIAQRVRTTDAPVPSAISSIIRGMIGFTIVSVAGFVPWAVFGRWFHQNGGEAGMYTACALVFILLSAPFLHRLILGPGSLIRFYTLFGIAFTLYSVAWIVGWMTLRGHTGSLVGLFTGALVMSAIFAAAFDAWNSFVKVLMAIFLLNALGYFVGGVVEGALIRQNRLAAMMSWGVCYGLGFGAGLGLAFHLCQSRARALLATR